MDRAPLVFWKASNFMNSSGYGQKEKITMKKKLLALVLATAMTLSLNSWRDCKFSAVG